MKEIYSTTGDTPTIKKLQSGDLLVEVANQNQESNVYKLKNVVFKYVSVLSHKTLNQFRSVNFEPDLQNIHDSEILENFKPQRQCHLSNYYSQRQQNFQYITYSFNF